MNSTPEEPTTTAPPPSPRRFLRAHDDRVLGGVAGGLGRAFGVDAVIFRIALAALVFAGGVGLLAYGAALLLVPADDGTGRPAPREGIWRTTAAVVGGGLLLIAALVVLGDGGFWAGSLIVPAAFVVGVGYVVVRVVAGDGGASRREPLAHLLVAATVGVAVVVGAGAAFWGSAVATAAGAGIVVAAVVLALGLGLVAAALRGDRRARWLALPALIVAFPATVVSAADISLDGGVGERSYRPTGADPLPAGYRLGAGELVVDLRGVDWRDGRRVALDVDMGVGHAVVIVPESVCVGARSSIGAGYADVFGRDAGGVDVEHDVSRTPAPGAPGLSLAVELGAGAFEVLHRDPQGRDRDDPRRFGRDREQGFETETFGDEDDERRDARQLADRACAGGAA